MTKQNIEKFLKYKYVEHYSIGDINFSIDNYNRVWMAGCRISETKFSISTARKYVFEVAKTELKSRSDYLLAKAKAIKDVRRQLKEPFDIRVFKKDVPSLRKSS